MNEKKDFSKILLIFIYTLAILVFIVFGLYIYKNKFTFIVEIEEISISLGEKYKIQPISDKSNVKYVYKSKNKNILLVDEEGYIIPKEIGETEVIITSKRSLSKEKILVKVIKEQVETITFNSEIKLKKNGEAKCYPIINGDTSFVANLVYRSLNDNVVLVDNECNIKAISEGTTKIIASSLNGIEGELIVTVEKDVIEAIELNVSPDKIELNVGEKKEIKASVLPKDATNKTLTWVSSNPSIVNVNQEGLIKANKNGEASIIVKTSNDISRTIKVIVKDSKVEATGIKLNNSEVRIKLGDTYQLNATITPSNATVKNISWEVSNSNIVTISNNGLIQSKGVGKTEVIAKLSNGKKAICSVVVYEEKIDATSVELNQTSTILDIGNSITLSATVLPENATNKKVSWTSSDSNVVTVDANGRVTAKKSGRAIVTVKTENGKIKECIINVPEIKVLATKVTLNNKEVVIDIGKNFELIATITPTNTTDKNIVWTSSNTNIVTVNSNGVITAKKAGEVTITAKTSNGKTATCKVVVKDPIINITGISLNKSNLVLTGGSYTLVATVSPSNATNKNVTWSSSNTNVATVKDGLVVAKSTGTTIITAKSSNGKTVTCEVKVEATFTNPIKHRAADPWAYKHTDGYYYVMWSPSYCGHKSDGEQNRVKIYRTRDLTNITQETYENTYQWIDNNEINTVADSFNCIWAPEIHYIDGYWYIYYSDTPDGDRADTSNRRMYVVKSKTSDPWGEYYSPRPVTGLTNSYQIQNNYAIDGTVLELNNQLYFVWSSKDMSKGRNDPLGVQSVYIASMKDPFTLNSKENIISSPTYLWEGTLNSSGNFECSCSDVDNCCADDNNEGPQILKDPSNEVHIIYSASAANMHYKLGMLTYVGGNPLSINSWLKYSNPLFQTGNNVYGPGHAAFTTSPDGSEHWIIYHGYSTFGDNWSNRHIRIQPFSWIKDSQHKYIPNFGTPMKEGTSLNKPSGTRVN